jgi:hypothetical protein
MDARAEFTAPRAGAYTVRVSAAGAVTGAEAAVKRRPTLDAGFLLITVLLGGRRPALPCDRSLDQRPSMPESEQT